MKSFLTIYFLPQDAADHRTNYWISSSQKITSLLVWPVGTLAIIILNCPARGTAPDGYRHSVILVFSVSYPNKLSHNGIDDKL